MKTGELFINPTSLIAPTLHGYRQAINNCSPFVSPQKQAT